MQCSHITRIPEENDKNKYVCHAAQKNANVLKMRQKFEMLDKWCVISKQSIQNYHSFKNLNYTSFIVKQINNRL